MKKRPFSLPPIVENLIIGTLTGVLVGYIVKFLLNRYEEATLVMIVLVLIGVVLGVLSGFERKRMLKLRLEKLSLEEDLVKSQASLRKSANKYRLLIENASDAIFLTTKNGRFLLFNEATCLLSGYSKNQLKEVKLSQLQAVDGDDKQDKMSQAWLDNSICRYEEDWRTKSGQIVTLEISAKWFQLGGNELTLHVGRDIMHRKEVSDDSKTKEVRTLQYAKLIELAMTQNNFYQEIVDPVNDTIRIFNHLSKNHPEMKDKLLGSISKWEKARGFLQGMLEKNIRDL